jgi:putative Ca2+/H+ antiporter (TMEM165/GDT1 family)
MIKDYIQALFFILMAEMGDKTQLLALAFATQFKVLEVLLGVGFGSLLNHGLAVVLGTYLSTVIPMDSLQILAGFLFVCFAFWTLRLEDEEQKVSKNRGPILTVALAFFIGELGDKTQLTAITLSADAHYPLFVLFGTVTGMILVSGVGIFIGSKIGKAIPEVSIKIISASIFMAFGLFRLYRTLPPTFLQPIPLSLFLILFMVFTLYWIQPFVKAIKEGKLTALQEAAITLYEYKQRIKHSIEEICLGSNQCGECQDLGCVIGYTKYIMQQIVEKDVKELKELQAPLANLKESLNKGFNEEKVIHSLSLIVHYLSAETEEVEILQEARKILEVILFGDSIEWKGLESYTKEIKEKDKQIGEKIMIVSK